MVPKVSVIVPNYNHARYLPERIKSILGQTYADYELLLLDDCSTDDSRDVIQTLAATDGRIRTVFNTANSGSGYRQWDRGVRETTGQYIWIAESDDAAEPELLESLVARLDAHKEVGIAYCQSRRLNENSETIGSMLEWTSDLGTDRWERDFVANGTEECRRYLCQKNTIPNASGVVFRRDIFEEIGGVSGDFKLCADWHLWARMLTKSNLSFVARPLNQFRLEQGSVTQNRKKDGTIALESYRVAWAIQQLTGVAPESLELSREKMYYVWTYPQRKGDAVVTIDLNWRIYREARRFDPSVHVRLLRDIRQSARERVRSVLGRKNRAGDAAL